MKTMKPHVIPPTKGKILVSEPFMQDFYFKRSVILLAEHNEQGTFGIILNKPIDIKFNEIIQDFPDFDASVYVGGPVSTDSIFYIHTLGKEIEGSMKIANGIYWGGNIAQIKDRIVAGTITGDQIRFFVGYSGWDPKQLDHELEEHSWVVSKIKPSLILEGHSEKLWKIMVKSLGKEYLEWMLYPADPSLN